MFKDYVVQLLGGVQNVTYIQHNYLHTVIAVDNTQIMGNVLGVFKQSIRPAIASRFTGVQKNLGKEVS